MNQLIISLAFAGREDYPTLQKKLIESIENNWMGDVWMNPDLPFTPHASIPYAFKYDLIQAAIDRGYTKIWWMDSTMRLNKDISVLLEESDSGLVAFDNLGHPLYKYISDAAVANLPPVENLSEIKQIWGGVTGWNFEKPNILKLFTELQIQIEKGSFNEGGSTRGGFVAHRHDQAVLSLLAYRYGIELLPYGVIALHKDVTEKTYIKYGD